MKIKFIKILGERPEIAVGSLEGKGVVSRSTIYGKTLTEILQFRSKNENEKRILTFLNDGEDDESSLSFGELDLQAKIIAGKLQNSKAYHERALLLYPPGLEYIASFFGCLYAGTIAVPAYPPNPNRLEKTLPRLQLIIRDCGAKYILTTRMIASMAEVICTLAPELRKLEWIATDDLPHDLSQTWKQPQITKKSIAFLQYTSGSTGDPKGVMISHQNLMINLEHIYQGFEYQTDNIGVSWLPPYHDMGLIGTILHPVHCGTPFVLMSPLDFLKNPVRWLKAISKYRAYVTTAPNFGYDLCVRKVSPEEREQLDLSCWRLACSGAERIRAQTLENFSKYFEPCGFRKESFFPGYGLAEGTLMVTRSRQQEPPKTILYRKKSTDRLNGRPISLVGCGTILPDHELRIVNPHTRSICPEGELGEIWVKGPSIAQGYWKKPELTRKVFGATLVGNGNEKYLRTGDLGLLRDKELYVTGRIKDLIINRGKNYFAEDIERTSENSHKALRPGCGAAFSVDLDGNEKLVIVHEMERRYNSKDLKKTYENKRVLDPNTKAFTPELNSPTIYLEIIDSVRKKVTEEYGLQPSRIILIEAGSIPKTSSGKIQRFKCKEFFQNEELSTIYQWNEDAAPQENVKSPQGRAIQGDWENYLLEIWGKFLNLPTSKIKATDNIFSLGGDSLSILSIAGELSRELDITLDENIIYKNQTIEKLATYLDSQLGALGKIRKSSNKQKKYSNFLKPEKKEFFLEPLQQSFFINKQFGDILCYICGDLKITGFIDPKLLKKAFLLSFKRHPSLNLAYQLGKNGPLQFFSAKSSPFELETKDISSHTKLEKERLLESGLKELSEYEFDLESGANLKAILYKTNTSEYRLQANINHLAADGFSLPSYFNDLINNIYPAIAKNNSIKVPQTQFNFKEYCEIKSACHDKEQKEKDLAFWMKRFKNFAPFPPLPDQGNPNANKNFGLHWSLLDSESVEKLKKIARQNNTTLFSILFAAFFKLISARSNTEKLAINTPILNRRPYLKGISEILGCFTDILPVQLNQITHCPLIDLAKKVQSELSELLSHSSVSGVEVARLLAQKSKQKSKTLTPIIFSSAIFPDFGDNQLPSLHTISLEKVRTGAPATWLDVVMGKKGKDLFFSWNFNQARFSQKWIQTLAEQYLAILAKFIEEPTVAEPLDSLVSDEELKTYAQLNETQRDYGTVKALHQRIEEAAQQFPQKIALLHNGQTLSYQQLNEKANQLAHGLLECGVQKGEFISILCERNFAFIVGILGILKAGAAYVPIDPHYPQERKKYIINDAQSRFLLTSQQNLMDAKACIQKSESLETIICLEKDGGDETILSTKSFDKQVWRQNPNILTQGSDLAYMIYTSGSTGNPKGVIIQHAAIDNRLQWMQETFSIGTEDTIAQKTSQSFDVSVWEFFWPLQQGSRMLLIDKATVQDTQLLHEALKENNVSIMHFVPSLFTVFIDGLQVINNEKLPLPSLRWVITSGEALPAESVRRWQQLYSEIPIANLYGPTEAAVDVTFHILNQAISESYSKIPIGKPVSNTQVLILDEKGQLTPVGTPGEICLGGVQLAKGYWNKPKLTAEKFIQNPDKRFAASIPRLYKTGDLGILTEQGEVEYLGRLDFQVKIRGFRIELGEVEATLLKYPNIREAIVLVNEKHEKHLIAYITTNNRSVDIVDLKSFCQTKLPDYMVPLHFVRLDAIPLTANGKIDRKKLATIKHDNSPMKLQYIPPSTGIEKTLTKIVQEVVQLNSIGVEDNLFDIGATSLSLAKINTRVKSTLGLEVSLTEIFQYPSIGALAKHLSKKSKPQHANSQEVLERSLERASIRQRALIRRQR